MTPHLMESVVWSYEGSSVVFTAPKPLGYSEQGKMLTVSDQSNLGNTAREKTQDGTRTQN